MGLFDFLWKASHPHESETFGGKTHFDVERFDGSGKKDKSAGKYHISGTPHDPSMTDVHPPVKK